MTVSIENSRKKQILVVDDDPSFRSFVSMLLTKNGFQVTQACSGVEALQLIDGFISRDDGLDLLFTDLKMAPMPGMELINKVRELGIDVPVLIATGYLDEFSFEELQSIKRYKLLIKPFKPETLLECVGDIITS